MSKNIIKEIFIIILICIAIALVLAIILFGYSQSTNKIIPNKISYTTPENVSQEIASGDAQGTTPVTITYELDETNIDNSRKSGSYTSGRQNPFANIEKQETEENTKEGSENTNEENKNTTTSNSNSGATTNKETTNETHYLPSTGTK